MAEVDAAAAEEEEEEDLEDLGGGSEAEVKSTNISSGRFVFCLQ